MVMPASERSSPAVLSPQAAASSRAAAKPQRVLACILCQQRKVKCDRKFPCSNCLKVGVQCVPATLAQRQRRRRFAERELLERLRHYERLLRENSVEFEPLHTSATDRASPGMGERNHDSPGDENLEGRASSVDQTPEAKTNVKSKPIYDAKDFWHAMNPRSRDSDEAADNDNDIEYHPDDVREAVAKTYEQYRSDDHVLFGLRSTNIDLSTLHPDQVQIFRLWQIYLENVNPLLKVTHTPTLQARIIDAAGDVANISPPTLEALMFSIYCVSTLSLSDNECRVIFSSAREDLLARYRFGCQQALLNCEVFKTEDRDCLTALLLYLISARSSTDPRSLSSMLGVAVRIAQRMNILNESANAKCSALEAEMRRRLWWSLALFDHRMCEMSDYKATMMTPTWDCNTPLNVDDFDLRPEMKIPPAVYGKTSEALFAVIRGEVGDFLRNSAFSLDFINPALKAVAKDLHHGSVPKGGEVAALETIIEDKYLKFCNLENPLHFLTFWLARAFIAKHHLVEQYSKYWSSSAQLTDAQREIAVSYAIRMIECDTKIMTSPLTKGYFWFLQIYFPFPAYIHLVQDLRRRPVGEHVEKAWEAMSHNYASRFMKVKHDSSPFFEVFARVLLQAWEAYASVSRQSDLVPEPPRMVLDLKHKLAHLVPNAQNSNVERPDGAAGLNIDDISMPMPMDFGRYDLLYGIEGQGPAGSGPEGYPDISGQSTMGFDMSQLNWNMMNWNTIHGRGW